MIFYALYIIRKMKYMSEDKKPNVRELVLSNGMSYPNDEELIMLILGSGTKKTPVEQLAHLVLSAIEGTNPPDLVGELISIDGMGKTRALVIAASLELGRRLNRSPEAVLGRPKDVIPYVQHYAMQAAEHFVCVSLTGAREIISIRVLSVGSGNMAVLRPREIFCEAVKEHASAVVLCHNHPGGYCEPSDEDIETTHVLEKAADLLGIALLDHIIITRTNYFSFLEHSLLCCRDMQ